MTRITIVDKHDNVVGAEEQHIAREKGLIHRIARIFVLNKEGAVLIQKRSSQMQDNSGKWDQSAGGHVDEGEDYRVAAKRETQEELGITVNDLQQVGKFYVERPAPGGRV